MITTKRHVQGRKGRAAMELGKQRFVKQAHLEKEEESRPGLKPRGPAKLVHEARMVVNVPYVAGSAGGGGRRQGKGGGAAGGCEARQWPPAAAVAVAGAEPAPHRGG